jgi:peptide/nickel transport system ATP-binding protein
VTVHEAVLEAKRVGKTYGTGLFPRGRGKAALRDFSLAFAPGEARIVALAGQSGSGKTTAAQLLLGLTAPTEGAVYYGGVSLAKLSSDGRKRFRRDVQAVLQDPYASFNPVYRVAHVFDVVCRNFAVGGPGADRRQRVQEALQYVGLDPDRVLQRHPHQLSGGERQRVMIARTLLLRPRIVIADEPVSMVDASIRSGILEIIVRLKQTEGISFVYVTHDLSTAYHIADELLVLYRGETVERGPARSVIDNPQHDYTRLLISSVPVPDPNVRWEGSANSANSGNSANSANAGNSAKSDNSGTSGTAGSPGRPDASIAS